LNGVNAAVIGLLVAALADLLRLHAVAAPIDLGLLVAALLLLTLLRTPPLVVVLVCAAGGAALS
jgi:chromate transporter